MSIRYWGSPQSPPATSELSFSPSPSPHDAHRTAHWPTTPCTSAADGGWVWRVRNAAAAAGQQLPTWWPKRSQPDASTSQPPTATSTATGKLSQIFGLSIANYFNTCNLALQF